MNVFQKPINLGKIMNEIGPLNIRSDIMIKIFALSFKMLVPKNDPVDVHVGSFAGVQLREY